MLRKKLLFQSVLSAFEFFIVFSEWESREFANILFDFVCCASSLVK